jgi:NADPH:quinone reductase-like Zn-dependent oxidoreductase
LLGGDGTGYIPDIAKGQRIGLTVVESNGQDMEQIAGWLANGDVKPYVFQDFPFSEMEAAMTQVASGSTRGPVVVSR